MFSHYLKVAFRNLWKFRIQSIISIIGLAVGFTCFALATLWIRYEMTYDTGHPDSDRIYQVYIKDHHGNFEMTQRTPYSLASYLKEIFPEIESSLTIESNRFWGIQSEITVEGMENRIWHTRTSPHFADIFDMKILEGNPDFLISESYQAAITPGKAKDLFGEGSPIGRKFTSYDREFTICALVEEWPFHSNYAFDVISAIRHREDDWDANWATLIKLRKGTDHQLFYKKLYGHTFEKQSKTFSQIEILPITEVHYKDMGINRNVQFRYLLFFGLAGLLVILSSLFNYITLFVSRFRMRRKELALRLVCGSSWGRLFMMLSLEFLITLLFSTVIGLVLIKLVLNYFKELSAIELGLADIYGEILIYIGIIIFLALFVFLLVLILFRKKTIQQSIQSNKYQYRDLSLIFQLIVSIGFIFCTLVIFKQIYFLHQTDLGFEYKNTLSITLKSKNIDHLIDNISKFPETEDVLNSVFVLLPVKIALHPIIKEWEGKMPETPDVPVEMIIAQSNFCSFYKLQLLAGDFPDENDADNYVLINETAVKAFGWEEPLGKRIDDRYTVKGVVKDIYKLSPTVSPRPILFSASKDDYRDIKQLFPMENIIVKYMPGTGKQIKDKIDRMIKTDFPELNVISVVFVEDEYDKFFTSERSLLQVLSFISLICILVSVFGFFSIISLNLEEKRKEIAIRKVNGAVLASILFYFFRRYIILLLIGSAIAFPVGYFLMKKWIESYTLQTTISLWIYLAIFFIMMLVIFLSVIWRVFKTAKENPADVLKTE
ncbi:MAG: ABC transporter permease [Bacteroidales bacterium]|jgi:ABC-type antimicrobial peptide transport system permease subunit|nr:ABC transporter permease [Bacteroidales bacterium]